MLKLEEIKSIDEGVVYLSHINNDRKKLTLDGIHLALKEKKGGNKDSYFNYAKMIIKSFDTAYGMFLPLIIMNPKRDELYKKTKSLMSEIKAHTKDFKIDYHQHTEEHPEALYVAFYLIKNQILPDKFGVHHEC